MTTRWFCLGNPPKTQPCDAAGTYEHTAVGGDSGPAWKHTKATGHATNCASVVWAERGAA